MLTVGTEMNAKHDIHGRAVVRPGNRPLGAHDSAFQNLGNIQVPVRVVPKHGGVLNMRLPLS